MKNLLQRLLARNTFRVASLGIPGDPVIASAIRVVGPRERASSRRNPGSYLLGQVAGQDWEKLLRATPGDERGLAASRATADAAGMSFSALDSCRDTNKQGRYADQSLLAQTQ